MIELGDWVHDLAIVLECEITVRTPFRHVQHGAVVACQLEAEPAQVRGGVMTKIDDHVEHGTADATHELHFLVRRHLVMKAPQRAASRTERVVALHERGVQPTLRELLLAPDPGEESACIPASFW